MYGMGWGVLCSLEDLLFDELELRGAFLISKDMPFYQKMVSYLEMY